MASGWVVGLLALLLARPRPASLAAGFALALLGEALRLWAAGHIEKTRTLATGGPYAHTRNPLYLGSLLIGLGVAVAAADVRVVLLAAAYFVAFYPAVMREEAAFLRQRFADEYAAWARAVPLFLPRPLPAGPRGSRFRWRRVASNREWRAAAALPALGALLYLRGLW